MGEVEQAVSRLTKAQVDALRKVCLTNGGGVAIPTGHSGVNYGLPTTHPWKGLWNLDLIQGKSGHAYRVVHTPLGLAVFSALGRGNTP